MIPAIWQKYLQKRGLPGDWRLEEEPGTTFEAAVVIPALAESGSLFATLESLAAGPADDLARTLVVVVVNNSPVATGEQRRDNQETLKRLRAGEAADGLKLTWVDAASAGQELPEKTAGAGLARKLGCDLSLTRLVHRQHTFIACLDADTLVEPGYLAALYRHFAAAGQGGAVLPFRHQQTQSSQASEAIELYELYLRAYPLGLHLAGSPYAYHTVGSAMACRADSYVRCGGMNKRKAGEDFYFLQQLAKTCGVACLQGTTVHPSPRVSSRTPFGTGPSMSLLLAGEADAVNFYHPGAFALLRDWLALVEENIDAGGEELVHKGGEICLEMVSFLVDAGFAESWDSIRSNSPGPAGRRRNFHDWFDALRTFRCVRHLDRRFPRMSPEQTVASLLGELACSAEGDPQALNRFLLEQPGRFVP